MRWMFYFISKVLIISFIWCCGLVGYADSATIYNSDGSYSTRNGNTTYNSDGSYSTRVGP